MSSKATHAIPTAASTRCDEFVSIPIPLALKDDLRRLAARDCSALAATARRLLARSVDRELAALAAGGAVMDPLGISFSPFTPGNQNGQNGQGGGPGGPAPGPTAQSAIQTLSFRPPRTVGASSPVAGPLLNAPGGASFGANGQNLDQLLNLLFGVRRPGMSGLFGGVSGLAGPPSNVNEQFAALFGSNGGATDSGPGATTSPVPHVLFGDPGSARVSPPVTEPLPWEPTTTPSGPSFGPNNRPGSI